MSELSREQIERLRRAGDNWFLNSSDERTFARAIAPTVAAMLDEARAEGFTAGRVTVALEALAAIGLATDGDAFAGVRAALARHASDAAGAPLTDERTSGGAGVPEAAAGAAEGRVGP